ncbi:MAG: DUF3043 domain-containing protein [Actinomycetaceae bacterium]|nr:DUF3043 domain-containing protein [Actinomycetaceae bacterium]
MFGSKNNDADKALEGIHELDSSASTVENAASSRQKKGPTPTRKQAQQRNYRPVVSPGTAMTKEQKRELRQQQREKQNELWQLEQEAMRTGDERNMPARYKGVERRFARDYADARFELASGFIPMAILFMFTIFLQGTHPQLFFWATIAFYVIFALMAVDAWIAARNARTLVAHKFGANRVPQRLVWDTFLRVFMPGRWRRPWPQTKLGKYPEGGTPADLREAKKAKKSK